MLLRHDFGEDAQLGLSTLNATGQTGFMYSIDTAGGSEAVCGQAKTLDFWIFCLLSLLLSRRQVYDPRRVKYDLIWCQTTEAVGSD